MNQPLEEINNRRKSQRAQRMQEVYKAYKDLLWKNQKRPSFEDILEEVSFNCTRQNIQLIMNQLKEEGYLIPFDFYKNQKVEMPHDWIDRS